MPGENEYKLSRDAGMNYAGWQSEEVLSCGMITGTRSMKSHLMIVKTAARLVPGALLVVLLAGCSTSQPVDTAAVNSPLTVQVVGPQPVDSQPAVKRDTGTYPTFGKPITSAADQMSDAEALELQKRLSSLASARKAGQVSDAEYRRQLQELQNIAAHHGADAQAQIEQ